MKQSGRRRRLLTPTLHASQVATRTVNNDRRTEEDVLARNIGPCPQKLNRRQTVADRVPRLHLHRKTESSLYTSSFSTII